MRFYVGIHMLAHAFRFEHCMISRNVLRRRRADRLEACYLAIRALVAAAEEATDV